MTRANGSFDFFRVEYVCGTQFNVDRTYFGGQLAVGEGVTELCKCISLGYAGSSVIWRTLGGRFLYQCQLHGVVSSCTRHLHRRRQLVELKNVERLQDPVSGAPNQAGRRWYLGYQVAGKQLVEMRRGGLLLHLRLDLLDRRWSEVHLSELACQRVLYARRLHARGGHPQPGD